MTEALKTGVDPLPDAYAECVSDEADGFKTRLGCHGPGARSGYPACEAGGPGVAALAG